MEADYTPAPGGDPGGELTGMYVPRVGSHLEDGIIWDYVIIQNNSRVPSTCLSRDSLQLWFFPWRTSVPPPTADLAP